MIDILKILLTGGILAAGLNLLFHYLSLNRHYQQALEQKMIDRISNLVEGYYGQISSASEGLRSALNETLPRIAKGEKAGFARQICFYHLIGYLHHVERLTQERPKPILTEINAERDYIKRISKIYEAIPFGYYDISFLLARCRISEKLMPIHEFVELIEEEDEVKTRYEKFCEWLGNCSCGEATDENCTVHRVMVECRRICLILDDQTRKMYRLWYERRKKSPKQLKD